MIPNLAHPYKHPYKITKVPSTKKTLWSPDSWQHYPAKQQAIYEDKQALAEVLKQLRRKSPLVFINEIEELKRNLSEAQQGGSFLIQAGDCAERFIDCHAAALLSKLSILTQVSTLLCQGLQKKAIRVGRMAGQYAKPRSTDMELFEGRTIPSFRGDSIHSFNPKFEDRQPDPKRLLQAYQHSAWSTNFIRSLTSDQIKHMYQRPQWRLDSFKTNWSTSDYNSLESTVLQSLQLAAMFDDERSTLGHKTPFYTSHEGLLLPFEQAMTRHIKSSDQHEGGFYNVSAHMLWIGDRTRDLEGAHTEYFRGISNPIGIKIGPNFDPFDITLLLKKLNPANKLGKIILIPRFGADKVADLLPKLILAVQQSRQIVLWSCDPMHGNSAFSALGRKTRVLEKITEELRHTQAIHRRFSTYLGGLHLELTGEDVTECLGGSENINEDELEKSYETYCDPRLNYSQSLELAFHFMRNL